MYIQPAHAIFTIYHNPSDFEGDFVVRCYDYKRQPLKPEPEFIRIARTLEEARTHIPVGFTMVPRDPSDDPIVVESWL